MLINRSRKKRTSEKSVALFEIITIVLSTIAFIYLVAMTIPSVSASCTNTVTSGCISLPAPYTGSGPDPVTIDSDGSANSFCNKLGITSASLEDQVCQICSGNHYINVPPSTCGPVQSAPPTPSGTPIGTTIGNGALGALTNKGLDWTFRHTGLTGTTTPTPTPTPTPSPTPTPTPNPTEAATGLKGFFVNPISFLTKKGPIVGGQQTYYTLSISQIVTTAAVATGLYYVTQWGLQQAGLNKETAHAAGLGVSLGYFAGHIASKLGIKILGFGSLGIGIAVGVLVFILTFKSTKTQKYQFNCYVWQAPTGGQNCAQCNQGDIPCTEYTCKSLGQGCVLVNQGTNQELCVWNNSKDVAPPIMTPWTDVLTNGYKYIPDNQQAPNDNGVRIVPINNNSGCVNSSSGVTLGLTLDKPGICKWDVQSLSSFDAMQFYFNSSPTAKYNHSQYFPIPDPNALASENVTLENGNNYAFYTRCQSTNGYSSVGNFVFKFCVNPSPDTTAPAIVETSIINGSSIAFNQNNTGLMTVYVQDSNTVNCKWSKTDQDYSTMENNMNCPTSIFNANSKNVYACTTTLTGLLNSQNNNFYFRCQDNSPQQNVNSQSYVYVLKGTQTPLIITSIGPNGTIMNATSVIKSTLTATTFGGSDNGNSQCSFSPTNSSYVTFFSDAANTTNYQHSQDLYLVPGNYQYYIQCRDLGGNTATNMTSFTVQSDTTPPIVVRAYNQNNNLNIITDENSTCVYNTDSNIGCTYNFADGQSMQNVQGNMNQVPWDTTKTFYIKCIDSFGNQPDTDACSIIASPYTISNSSQ